MTIDMCDDRLVERAGETGDAAGDAEPVAPSLPRRLRVVVLGNSVAFYVRPRRQGRHDGPYGERLEAALRARGIDATVVNEAGWMMQVHEITPEIPQRVLAHNPDVVIVNVGWMECQPRVLPTPALRWLYTWRPNLNPAAVALRRRAEPPVRRFYERWSPRLIDAMPRPPHRLSPGRFEQELARLVGVVQGELGALIVLLNVNPTTDRVADALPGIHQHAAAYSRIVEDIAARTDGVALVDTRALVDSHGAKAVLPDGIHFNGQGHQLVADQLDAIVVRWLGSRAGY